MRNFVDEGGKGTQGFIEVIMDEIDDIKIDLAKKVSKASVCLISLLDIQQLRLTFFIALDVMRLIINFYDIVLK